MNDFDIDDYIDYTIFDLIDDKLLKKIAKRVKRSGKTQVVKLRLSKKLVDKIQLISDLGPNVGLYEMIEIILEEYASKPEYDDLD
jgi:hypothetical protein